MALCAAFLVSAGCTCGELCRASDRIASSVVRLHVVADSDDPQAQAVKLKVRDAVLKKAENLLDCPVNRTEACAIIENNKDTFADAACRVLCENGADYGAAVSLETAFFPTRHYGGLTLPAGRYRALSVRLGKGRGQNFWCVLFPSLCLGGAEALSAVKEDLPAGDYALCAGDGRYAVKFKALELLEQLRERKSKND